MILNSRFTALALLLAAVQAGVSQTQLVNPNPKDCCKCIEITKIESQEEDEEDEEEEEEDQPDQSPPIIYPDTDGNFTVPVNVTVKAGEECKAAETTPPAPPADHSKDVKLKTVVLRPAGSSSSPNQEDIPVNTDGTSASKEVTLLGSTVTSSGTKEWEIFVTCTGNAMVPPNAADPDGSCSYRITLGGCKSCQSGSCPTEASNTGSGLSMDVPLGSANAGDSVGSIRYQSKGTVNPGPAGIAAFVPSGFQVNRNASGAVTSVVTPVNTIEVSASPTTFDPKAFTINHKRAGATVPFRTTTVSRVQEGGTTWIRSDSNFSGTTFRYQQSKTHAAASGGAPATDTWTMESGPLVGTAFTPLRKEILKISEPQPGTRIHRETVLEPGSGSSDLVAISDTATTWNKFAWGWERTHEAVDPDGANLVNTWTYYQPGELSGPNGSAEGLGRLHTHTRYDGHQEIHTYWLNNHQTQLPFAADPQGLTLLSKYEPGIRTTTTTRTVGGNILSKESEIYNAAGDIRTSTTHTSANGTLTTTTILVPYGQEFGGQPKSVNHPDGTLTTYSYQRHSDGGKTIVVRNGAGTGSTITLGKSTTTTYNRNGTAIRILQETIGYPTNIILAHTAVSAVDDFGRALTIAEFPTASSAADGAIQASATDPIWSTTTTYSCCGVASETDRQGIVTTYEYDSLRRKIKSTTLGVTNEIVHRGLATESHRYPAGSSAAPGNLIARETRNMSGTMSSSWSPDPSSTTDGALVETTTSTSYGGGIATTATTVPGGASQTTQAYADGRTWKTSGELSSAMVHSYAVNSTGLLTTNSYVDGATPKETAINQTDWASRPLTTTKGSATTTYAYNSLGQAISTTDADGVRNLSAYNSLGEHTTSAIDINDNGQIDFNGTDRITVFTTAPATYSGYAVMSNISEVYASNDSGTVTTVATSYSTPDGLRSWSLTPGVTNPARINSTIGTSGAWTENTINSDGTQTLTTYTGGLLDKTEFFSADTTPSLIASTSLLYDSLNRPWKQNDSRTGTTETAYVSVTCDMARSSIAPGNLATSFSYDSNGRRLTTTLPDNTVTHSSYYPSGEIEATWGSQTYPIYYTYDHAGRKSTMRTKPTLDGNGVPTNDGLSLTIWNYSSTTGQLLSKLDANDQGPSYTYTAAGRLLTRTWARPISTTDATKVKTTYGYVNGRVATVTYNDGTPDLEYTYTRFGAKDIVKRGGVVHADYDYDSTTLALTTEKLNQDTPVARSLARYQDSLGRPLSLEISGEYTAAYGYDNAGRFKRVWNQPTLDANKAPTGSADFTYGYEANSQGLIHTVTGPAHTVTNAWDANRDSLVSKINSTTAGATSSFKYGVNAIGQRETVGPVLDFSQQPVSTYHPQWGWAYNTRGELVTADDTAGSADRAYQYDAIGNREKSAIGTLTLPTNLNYVANSANQYTVISSFASQPQFDSDGNMTAGPVPGIAGLSPGVPSPASATLKWDAENRLVEATVSGNTVTSEYDHLSRLISRTASGTTTRYLYDSWNRIEEFNGPTLQKIYTWGMDVSGTMQGAGGIGGLLAINSGGSAHYPTYDGSGNVSEYLTSTGSVAAHFEYDPFGNLTIDTQGNAEAFLYRFSTKPQDATTGLYYFGYRYYEPVTGRWPSRDPIGEEGGVNLYGFVTNNAISMIDLNGTIMRDLFQKQETTDDFDPNKSYPSHPGGPLLPNQAGALALTVIEHKVKATCECRNFGRVNEYHILKSYDDIKFFAHVYLMKLESYPEGKVQADWVALKEQDHVVDIEKWIKGREILPAVDKIESMYSVQNDQNKFKTNDDCVIKNQARFATGDPAKQLRKMAAEVIEVTIENYDKKKQPSTGKPLHTWISLKK